MARDSILNRDDSKNRRTKNTFTLLSVVCETSQKNINIIERRLKK